MDVMEMLYLRCNLFEKSCLDNWCLKKDLMKAYKLTLITRKAFPRLPGPAFSQSHILTFSHTRFPIRPHTHFLPHTHYTSNNAQYAYGRRRRKRILWVDPQRYAVGG
uniref:Uncharacterized protein n=1 Tax=Picea glauca TaxID=3330 RepID=A0A101M072_PICGL|nr:hypothetical protein ABT39_MTgene4610 [Picea glauca]QHR92504.1 hypothetical protein Q903MT_gene6550 [Picea sitchensis]